MPVTLDDLFQTSEITLPVSGAKVKVKYQYTLDEDEAIAGAGDRQGRLMALYAIKSWDIVNVEQAPLPITDDNVGRLPGKDILAILNWLTKRITKENEKDKTQEEGIVKEDAPAMVIPEPEMVTN